MATIPMPFLSRAGCGSRRWPPAVLQHLGGWRELPPAALTAFKGTARNRCGHPTACVGLAASECPFSRLALHIAKSAQPWLPGSSGRKRSLDLPLLLALENEPSHLPTTQLSRRYPACLLANELRPLVSQPDAEATHCSIAAQHTPDNPPPLGSV